MNQIQGVSFYVRRHAMGLILRCMSLVTCMALYPRDTMDPQVMPFRKAVSNQDQPCSKSIASPVPCPMTPNLTIGPSQGLLQS